MDYKNKKLLRKMRRLLWLMGKFKIPMIAYVKPKILALDEEQIKVRIKLRRRTKNHLSSMYFGSLAVGADVAAGLHAFYFAELAGEKISFAFKSVNGEFLKRATTDVVFISKDGLVVKETFKEAMETKERINRKVNVEVMDANQEIVAKFVLEISVKVKTN
ncbi:MAG TPA: DUF4442 domain-containing protein [Brumimicrobium sp.]|nr:DUF4442 domain-containing protein [Brumimicrobium sp.]